MRPVLATAACLLLTAVWACTGAGHETVRPPVDLPAAGTVHERIVCKADSSLTYALYIPASAGKSSENTVAILLDPHAAGSLPVKLYKDLAERFSWVLIGSNDSKNGLSSDVAGHIVSALATDAGNLFGADSSRLYLVGFSGGARVATTAALYLIPVKGVVACGAGFGTAGEPPRHRFDFFGLAGRADFNMNELLALRQPLAQAGFRSMIVTFPGKHAWPPPGEIQEAIRWHTFNAFRAGEKPKNQSLILEADSSLRKKAALLESHNNYIAASEVCRLAISDLEGLAETGSYNEQLKRLEGSAGYKAQADAAFRRSTAEESEKQELVAALQTENVSWWKEKVRRYAQHPKGADPEDTLKNARVLSFLSLYCYMSATKALNSGDGAVAAKFVGIYTIVDPENPEPEYMKAVLLARDGKNEQAVTSLKSAVKKGFRDRTRTESQPEFRNLQASAGWNDLLKSMQ